MILEAFFSPEDTRFIIGAKIEFVKYLAAEIEKVKRLFDKTTFHQFFSHYAPK